MTRQAPFVGLVLAAVLGGLTGCQPQQPFYLHPVDDELAHYKGVATEIEYPDVEADRLADVSEAPRPFSLLNKDKGEIWDLTLEQVIELALQNNKVMRNLGGQLAIGRSGATIPIQAPPDFLTRNSELIPTIYGPALAESNPRTGVEAALSAFDAQLGTSLLWQKTDAPQNIDITSPLAAIFPNVSEHDLATFQAKLSKITATGGQWSLAHNVAYDLDKFDYPIPRLAYASDWNVNLEASWRQPMLQGAGVQFNRIAGPGAQPGIYNGVVLARINTDIALSDFEMAVRNLVSDVESAYWELYFAYRSLDAVKAGQDAVLSTWRKTYTLYRIGSKGGEAEKEAQARQQVYLFRADAEQRLTLLYHAEANLRYLMGIAATDGRLIRPKDEPTTAKVSFDWCEVLSEGLARSVELRQQKWIVKRRELELIAAKNFLLPKVDFVALYRWLGLGNELLPVANGAGGDFTQVNSNAYQSMTNGAFQEWQFGFQGNIPLGFRRELSGVRNAQLSLTQERAKLQEGELELSHQLAYSMRDMDAYYVLTQTNFNHRVAAQREVEAVDAAYETDTVTIDRLLDAQQKLAQAESDYFRSVVNYVRSITQLHFRKGSLLEYNGVYLAEGPWPGKAYFDARRRARARAAATYLDYGFTQPRVMSRGPIEQHPGGSGMFDGGQQEAPLAPDSSSTPSSAQPELVPTPEPQPVPSSAMPLQPKAPQPASESFGAATSGRTEKNGWTAVMTMPGAPAGKSTDRRVAADGWTEVHKASFDEPDANPSTAAVDRPSSGWKRVQR